MGPFPRCFTHLGTPRGLVPVVNQISWLRQTTYITDPNELVSLVKQILGLSEANRDSLET